MNNAYEKAEAARNFIQEFIGNISLEVAVVTGTGLGEIWLEMEVLHTISYQDIPHFSKITVESHYGKLFICKFQSVHVAVLSGRFHYYEGYSAAEIIFPVRVMKLLGINRIMLTNASGGLNTNFRAGSIVAITDHINLQPAHPLRGLNDDRFGDRFPDMMHAYDKSYYDDLEAFAQKGGESLHRGVYLVLQGPTLETPAEYEFVKRCGADLVGMSTVPEAITANHMGMQVAALSVVSNMCYPIESITETTLEEVIHVANSSIPIMTKFILHFIMYKKS